MKNRMGIFILLLGALAVILLLAKSATVPEDEDSQLASGAYGPVMTNVQVSNITATGAMITWTTDVVSSSQVKVKKSGDFQWTAGTIYDSPAQNSGVTTHSVTITNLIPNTAYNYRAKSCDVANNCRFMPNPSTLIFTTLSQTTADTQPPSVPVGLTATNVTSTGFTLSWLASTDDTLTAPQIHYDVYGPTASCGTSGFCGTTTGSTTFSITGLSPATTYSGTTGTTAGFTVQAYDTAIPAHYSAPSVRLTVTTAAAAQTDVCPNLAGVQTTVPAGLVIDMSGNCTAPADTTAPSVPTSLASPTKTTNTVSLSWTASTDNVGVAGYNVYINGSGTATNASLISGTSYTVTGLTASTPYSFTVKAKDAAGNLSTASAALTVTTSAAADIQAPTAPTNLTSTSKTTTTVSLSWTASTDNVGVAGYYVYVNNSSVAQNGSAISGTTYTVTGLTASTSYGFTVKAKDAAGNTSPASNLISITTNAPADTTAPTISGVTSSSITQTGAMISWTTNEAANSQIAYGTTSGSYTSLWPASADPTMLTAHNFQLSGLTAGTTYYYVVKSADAAGNLATSTQSSFTTTAAQASCPNTPTTAYKTGMWIWKDNTQIITAGTQNQTDLWNFVSTKKVDTIYLYANKSFLQNSTNAANLRIFLNTAWNTYCVKVQLLDGDVTWMFTPGNPYNTIGAPTTTAVTDWVNQVKTFNATITGTGVHPVGIHLDAEAHGNTYWNSNKTVVAQAYLYMLDGVKSQLAGTGLQLISDVPRWYDTATGLTDIAYNGVTKNFMKHIFDRDDQLGIMDYVVSTGSAYSDALGELQYGLSIGKPVVIGFETIDLTNYGGGNGTTSFYGTSCAQLNSAIATVYNSVVNGGYTSALGSFAVHMYKGSGNVASGWTALCGI